MKEEALLTGSLLDYVNFTELLASTTHVQDEDAPAIAKVQRVLRRVIRETDDCQVVRKYKVGGLGYISVLVAKVWLDRGWTQNPIFVQHLSRLCPVSVQ